MMQKNKTSRVRRILHRGNYLFVKWNEVRRSYTFLSVGYNFSHLRFAYKLFDLNTQKQHRR